MDTIETCESIRKSVVVNPSEHWFAESTWIYEEDFASRPLPDALALDEKAFFFGNIDHSGLLRVWSSGRGLVATRSEARFSEFEVANTELAAQGWPVCVRRTGGSCVPQGAGVINFSMTYLAPCEHGIDEAYQFLCGVLSDFLQSLNIQSETGEVAHSFCDGRFNLQSSGKKVVGTAQRRRLLRSSKKSIILAHACVLVELDLDEATGKINELYRLAGGDSRYDPNACTTLAAIMGVDYPGCREIRERLGQFIKEKFTVISSSGMHRSDQ